MEGRRGARHPAGVRVGAAITAEPVSRHRADVELASAIGAGDPNAFEKFFEAWFPHVVAFARREAASDAAAERLVERAFALALAQLAGYRGERPLAAIVFACCRAAARRVVREDP
jgi:DNA-directed RNA polymerase specialized sigma24 family protein